MTGLEIRLSAAERRGDIPWQGALAVAWIRADGHTVEAFAAEASGTDAPRISWRVADVELRAAAVVVSWLVGDAATYREA